MKLINCLFAFLFPCCALGKDLVIAVIDTGVDKSHPQIQSQLWVNPGEIPDNGIDDDGNGYVDDVYGWNFVTNDPDISDHHGHGTHISGLIVEDNPHVKIMTLKYFDTTSALAAQSNLDPSIKALEYAIRMGAQIINYSGGGSGYSSQERSLIEKAGHAGILVITAAGNEASNSDKKRFYPAGYELPNLLAVTATNKNRALLPTSNYGVKTSQLAALGENVISSLPHAKWGSMTGTSQATAKVTQAVAHLLNLHKELKSPQEIVHHLLVTGSYDSGLNGKTSSSSHLDLYNAISSYNEDCDALGEKNKAIKDPKFYVIDEDPTTQQ